MTREEFMAFSKRLETCLYDLYGAVTTNAGAGERVIVTERECMAIGCGVSAASVLMTLSPPKPVGEMTERDIEAAARSVVETYAGLLRDAGLSGGEK